MSTNSSRPQQDRNAARKAAARNAAKNRRVRQSMAARRARAELPADETVPNDPVPVPAYTSLKDSLKEHECVFGLQTTLDKLIVTAVNNRDALRGLDDSVHREVREQIARGEHRSRSRVGVAADTLIAELTRLGVVNSNARVATYCDAKNEAALIHLKANGDLFNAIPRP